MLTLMSAASAFAQPPPLLHITFEESLANSGSLGGEARFEDYAPGEEARFALGPWGWCLDNTAASRHGGTTPNDPPAGSAVAFEDTALDGLTTYTLTCWFRRPPDAASAPARLFCKLGLLDVIPSNSGFSLGIGEGAAKAITLVPSASPMPPPEEWTFAALVVDAAALTARLHTGSRDAPPVAGKEVPVPAPPPPTPGPLLIGNAFRIRPFRSRVDNVSVFDQALGEADVRAIYEADAEAARVPSQPLLPGFAWQSADPRRSLFRPADICFSTRWQNDAALPVLEAFHVTRDLWTYGTKREFADKVKAMGITYQGTLNGMWAAGEGQPEPQAASDTTGRAYDLDGMKYVPTWMRGWKMKVPNYIGCCNHPAFRALFLKGADDLLAAGADSLHVDDWAMNATWCEVAGVCFCEHCLAGFREHLRRTLTPEELAALGVGDIATFDYATYLRTHDGVQNADDYRKRLRELPLTPQFVAFQTESVRRFYRDLHDHLDQQAGRHVPVSWNNQFADPSTRNEFRLTQFADLCDFQVGEKFREDFATHLIGCKLSEALGQWQVISPMPHHLGPTYSGLATTYALGQLYLVPWDIYMGVEPNGPPLPRFFGTSDDFGPYYDLIHGHPELFDGYATLATVGVLVNLDQPVYAETSGLCERLAREGVPFRIIAASARYARFALQAGDLAGVPLLLAVSPPESFTAEDQTAIREALATRRVLLKSAGADFGPALRDLRAVRVEGPEGVLAFVRTKPREPASFAIHLVNWDLTPDGSANEAYGGVTVALLNASFWGRVTQARYFEPGVDGATEIPLERHPHLTRLTVPHLGAWGILEVR